MRRALPLLCALGACSQSAVTDAPLSLTSVQPSTASARGGTVLHVRGRGFAEGTRLFVQGVEVPVEAKDPEVLDAVLPPLAAGPADVRVEHEDEQATLAHALQVVPIPIGFAEVPDYLMPALPGPVWRLLATRAGLVAGGEWGVSVLAWKEGKLSAAPLKGLEPPEEGAAPRLLAAAASADGARLALCVEDETPLRWYVVDGDRLAGRGSTGALPGTCGALAVGAAAVYVRAATEAGPRLCVWHPGADPAVAESPAIAALDDWLAADADGDGGDDLVVAGRDGDELRTEIWNARSAAFVNEGALPARAARTRALVAADLDGDGDADVFAAGDGADALFVNDSHGRFADDAWRMLPFDRATGTGAASADFDRDGRPDLVVATPDGVDRLYLGGPEGFRDATPLLGLETGRGGRVAAALDVDGDGAADVATVTQTGALRVRLHVDPPEGTP